MQLKKEQTWHLYKQKTPRINGESIHATQCKRIAMRDISKECGDDGWFYVNYIGLESIVLKMKKIIEEFDLNMKS